MSELDYDELDPGIRDTVRWLRDRGFKTTDSGDGATKLLEIRDEEALPYPHVFMVVDDANDALDEAHRLVCELRDYGIPVCPVGMGTTWIQLTYDPCSEVAVVELGDLNDSLLAERPLYRAHSVPYEGSETSGNAPKCADPYRNKFGKWVK